MTNMKHWPAISLTAGVLAVAVVATFAFCRPDPTPLPPKEAATAESLAVTKPMYEAHRDTLVRVETTYVARSRQKAASATEAEAVADSLWHVADAWQQAALAQNDTASRWFAIAETRRLENVQLRVANADLHAALADEIQARITADVRASGDSARLWASEDLNARLARDIKTVGQCRILPFVRCPTRKETALAVVAIDVGVRVIASRRRE